MTSLRPPVILVEDDAALRSGVREYLELSGFDVTCAANAREFYQEIGQREFDIAIIDLGLPDQDGEVLLNYTQQNTAMAVIILTARDNSDTRIACYQNGAALFLGKPIHLAELTAAMRSLLNRRGRPNREVGHPQSPRDAATQTLLDTEWRLHVGQSLLKTPQGTDIPLTGREVELLTLFVSRAGAKIDRASILEALYGRNDESAHRALDALVRRLRSKVLTRHENLPLRTHYASGYFFALPLVRC